MSTFAMIGNWRRTPTLEAFAEGLKNKMQKNGFRLDSEANPDIQLVLNFVDPDKPQHFRRHGKGTFVATIAETDRPATSILHAGYPILIRSLGNFMIYLDRSQAEPSTHFITLEQGCYSTVKKEGDEAYFDEVFARLQPLATSTLVIDNVFHPDLPETLWNGDETSKSLYHAGQKLDQMNLLPTPFPIEELLSPKELRHIKRLYGVGGLSYGNLSARQEDNKFWMSASGVNKSSLKDIGRDILLVKGFDEKNAAMELSVPPQVQPKRVSVDAIEHWMIYAEHPEVGAIVHIHAWMDGVPSTEVNYPCGSVQLAETVAELVRQSDNPAQTVIGLKNHGLTITGKDLDDIFERIDGKIIPQVPMG